MIDSINIAVIGSSGFVGLELIKILKKHKKVNIKYLCAKKSVGKSIVFFDKSFAGSKLPKISSVDKIKWDLIDLVFTSLPNGEAQLISNKIPKRVKLIDLAGDFRLTNKKDYLKWYKKKHKAESKIKDSIYSIPEFNKKKLKKYKIISCPGCYPTSIQLPLIPLLKNNMINEKKIIIDSKSGYSGAGKNFNKKFKFKNFFQTMSAYGVGNHKHLGEIDQELSIAKKKKLNVLFTPHLIPVFRGILSTIYLEPKNKYNAIKIYNYLKNFHKDNFFVKFAKFNIPINTGDVLDTNYCKISVCMNRNKNNIIIFSAIDNLQKGASGQAVQNMNILYGFKENEGLL